MNFEKNFASQKFENRDIQDQNLVVLKKQMEKAVKEEDYEQAAFIRDFIQTRQEKGIHDEIEMKDLLNTGRGFSFEKNDPRYRAWKSLDKLRLNYRLEGKEIIENSDLSEYLIGDYQNSENFREKLEEKFMEIGDFKGGPRVDLLINLRQKEKEAIMIRDLARQKLDEIWSPYREQAGLNESVFDEYRSSYVDVKLSPDQQSKIEGMPDSIYIPVLYWQGIYDNSRNILDQLNMAIDKLER